MKFTVKYIKEVVTVVDAVSLDAAAAMAARTAYREQGTKVHSVEAIVEYEMPPPKTPTPFDRPPSGTPGAGQFRMAA